MTNRLAIGFIALGAALIVSSAATAAPAYVRSTVNLRSGPATSNEVLGKIPAGSRVDADKCENDWCAVNWQGKSGYAIKSALDTSGRAPPKRRVMRGGPGPVPYDDDDDIIIGGPPIYYGPPVYPYPYYRPYGYYRYGGYYGYRHGWRRRW